VFFAFSFDPLGLLIPRYLCTLFCYHEGNPGLVPLSKQAKKLAPCCVAREEGQGRIVSREVCSPGSIVGGRRSVIDFCVAASELLWWRRIYLACF